MNSLLFNNCGVNCGTSSKAFVKSQYTTSMQPVSDHKSGTLLCVNAVRVVIMVGASLTLTLCDTKL